MDDPKGSVTAAIEKILDERGVKLVGLADFYETEPQGKTGQPWFVNTALAVEVGFSPEETLERLKMIEKEIGRVQTEKWGARKIDIDIIFYDDLTMDSGGLTIPHPLAAKRRFVLKPLADIDPALPHPALGKTVSQLLEELPAEGQAMRKLNR